SVSPRPTLECSGKLLGSEDVLDEGHLDVAAVAWDDLDLQLGVASRGFGGVDPFSSIPVRLPVSGEERGSPECLGCLHPPEPGERKADRRAVVCPLVDRSLDGEAGYAPAAPSRGFDRGLEQLRREEWPGAVVNHHDF